MNNKWFFFACFLFVASSLRADEPPPVASPPAPTAQTRFGEAVKFYSALRTLRVRWNEVNAMGEKYEWELRFRRLSGENAQMWVRLSEVEADSTNIFVYDGQRYGQFYSDNNTIESKVLPPAQGLARLFSDNPRVSLSFGALLMNHNLAADKTKAVAPRLEKGSVVFGLKLPYDTQTTRLTYVFDAQNTLKQFITTRKMEGFDATVRCEVETQEPNVALSDADFILKAPAPPKPRQTAIMVEPRAVETFDKAVQCYKNLKSWSVTIKTRELDDSKPEVCEVDFVRPDLLCATNGSSGKSYFLSGNRHWKVDPEARTYRLETKISRSALDILMESEAVPREWVAFLRGKNSIAPSIVAKEYADSVSFGAKRLSDAPFKGQLCERVVLIETTPPQGVLQALTGKTTFWIRASDGEVLRWDEQLADADTGQNGFATTSDCSQQRFNPTLPSKLFQFVAPRGFKKIQ